MHRADVPGHTGASGQAASRVQIIFSEGTRLTYALNASWTAQCWVSQLAQMRPEYLLQSELNHRHGFATVDQINQHLSRLQACCNALGFEAAPLTMDTWQQVLNQIHTRFPEYFITRTDNSKNHIAHETNLLIHWLECELANVLAGRQTYLFNLDFNHYVPAYDMKTRIPENELGYFSPVLAFGNLHLHYLYVGRHFLEMFEADDVACPARDFRPQHEFNATCGLVFSEPTDPLQQDAAMRAYFEKRGGKAFFRFDYESPWMAKGFFKLGELEDIANYTLREHRDALRARLQSAHVLGWVINPP